MLTSSNGITAAPLLTMTRQSGSIRLDPAYPAAFTGRGLAYEAKGDRKGAKLDFNAALAIPPKYAIDRWGPRHRARSPCGDGRANCGSVPERAVAERSYSGHAGTI